MASYFPPSEVNTDLVSDEQAHEAFARAVKTTSSRTEHDSALALFFSFDFDGYSKADGYLLDFSKALKEFQNVIAIKYNGNDEHVILKSNRPLEQENEQNALSEHFRDTRAALRFAEALDTARQTYDSELIFS